MISNRKIIDAHTHIFPENLAPRAVNNIGTYYNITMQGDGTAGFLVKTREKLPEIQYIICSATLKPESMRAGNDYLLKQGSENDMFIPLSSVYPFMPAKEAEAELVRTKEAGAHGVKLHPDFQHFIIDEPSMTDIYKICAQLELPVIFHVGDENTDGSSPTRLRRVVDKVPGLLAIAAHLGGYKAWDEAEKVLVDTNVFFDTSDALHCLPDERVFELVRLYGSKRVMFGSDFPFYDPVGAFIDFEKLPFSEEEKDDIYYNTASKLFKTVE